MKYFVIKGKASLSEFGVSTNMDQITNWQIILAIIIVSLSIIMPIYYSYQKKKKKQQAEHEKIKAYGENINQQTRSKH